MPGRDAHGQGRRTHLVGVCLFVRLFLSGDDPRGEWEPWVAIESL